MSSQEWDGPDLLEALRHATAALIADVDEVNALNVFPVPDGDTGSNMVATITAALDEALAVPDDERSVPRIANAFAFGALMGARGNSGVILSQLFRGMAAAVQSETRVGGRQLASAFESGRDAAYSAVAQPVEGTILTVATDASAAAARAARADASLAAVLSAAVEAAAESVKRTPTLLPLLAHAGVVDAGGRGLELLLRGARAFVEGKALPVVAAIYDVRLPDFDALEEEGFGYETVYLVTPSDGQRLAIEDIRRQLDELGESVLVAGDERAVKVHVHNARPDEVIAYGLTLGALSRITVENLDRQASEVRQAGERATRESIALAVPPTARQVAAQAGATARAAAITTPGAHAAAQRAEGGGPAIVAVAAGRGLARIFSENGVTAVIEGGQTANPSTGDLVAAIRGTGSSEVIVLPNNPNVRLAARQAGELLPDVRVEVVPTRNAAEGIAALLAVDMGASIERNSAQMARAARELQTMAVTAAVRDARIGRRKVKRGEHIVLGPDDGLLAADRDRTAAVLAALGKLKPGFELLTIYRGDGVAGADLDGLREAVAAAYPDVEVESVHGGQPHYSYLISAE